MQCAAISHAWAVRAIDVGLRHRQRHHSHLLRRQKQLWACYAFWVFPCSGHDNAKLWTVAVAKWEGDGRPMVKEVACLPRHGRTKPRTGDYKIPSLPRPGAAHVQSGLPLVDVRSPGEYTGAASYAQLPTGRAMRGGHIPGAHNVPWARAANPDGTSNRPTNCVRSTRPAATKSATLITTAHRRASPATPGSC